MEGGEEEERARAFVRFSAEHVEKFGETERTDLSRLGA